MDICIVKYRDLPRKGTEIWQGKVWRFGKEKYGDLQRLSMEIWQGKVWRFGKENMKIG